jgi:hypothetical protein
MKVSKIIRKQDLCVNNESSMLVYIFLLITNEIHLYDVANKTIIILIKFEVTFCFFTGY